MLPLEKFQAYLDTAAEQVRWKRARPALTQELRCHLLDQYDACTAAGLDEESAATETLRQMGDAVEVGTALDRAHRPKPQWGLLGLTGVVVVVGLLIQLAITITNERSMAYFYISLLKVGVGICCMVSLYLLDYTVLHKKPWFWCMSILALHLLMFLPQFRFMINGHIFFAQFTGLLLPVAYAILLYGLRGRRLPGCVLSVVAAFPFIAISALIPSLSLVVLLWLSSILLPFVCISKNWYGGNQKTQLLVLYAFHALTTLLGVLYFFNPVIKRLHIAFQPELYSSGGGFPGAFARSYLVHANWIGSGPAGISDAEWSLNKGACSDYIWTWLVYRAGWLAGIAVLLLLATLVIWGFLVCRRQQSMLGRLIGTSILLTLSFQIFVYILKNMGFEFFSLLTFPFLSFGKFHQLVNLSLLGLLFSVFRGEHLPIPVFSPKPAKRRLSRVTYQDGVLSIHLKKAPAPQK